MALKIIGAIAAAVGLKKSETPPWEGEAQDLKPLVQSGDVQVPPSLCTAHIWMGSTCVRCKATKPAASSSTSTPMLVKPKPPAAIQQVQAPVQPKPTKTGKTKAPPYVQKAWPEGKPYTILDALQEKWDGRPGVLMLVKISSGEGFKVELVREVGPTSAHVNLSAANGLAFSPRVGAREIEQYVPQWRD